MLKHIHLNKIGFEVQQRDQHWKTDYISMDSFGRIYLDQQHLSETAKKKCEHDNITITRAMYSN